MFGRSMDVSSQSHTPSLLNQFVLVWQDMVKAREELEKQIDQTYRTITTNGN